MWATWAPPGWYEKPAFDEACAAFDNPDQASIVVHSCRHRWGLAKDDPSYGADEAKLNPPPELTIPTLVLHGAIDIVIHPDTSAGKEQFFKGPYRRAIVEGVGHFPHREDPAAVANAVLSFVARLRNSMTGPLSTALLELVQLFGCRQCSVEEAQFARVDRARHARYQYRENETESACAHGRNRRENDISIATSDDNFYF